MSRPTIRHRADDILGDLDGACARAGRQFLERQQAGTLPAGLTLEEFVAGRLLDEVDPDQQAALAEAIYREGPHRVTEARLRALLSLDQDTGPAVSLTEKQRDQLKAAGLDPDAIARAAARPWKGGR